MFGGDAANAMTRALAALDRPDLTGPIRRSI
jgi:hypothetical protein